VACLGETTSAMQPLAMLQMNVDLAVWVAHWPRVVRAEMEVCTYQVLCGHESPARSHDAAPGAVCRSGKLPGKLAPRAQIVRSRDGRSESTVADAKAGSIKDSLNHADFRATQGGVLPVCGFEATVSR
jgi:hypothetical protein